MEIRGWNFFEIVGVVAIVIAIVTVVSFFVFIFTTDMPPDPKLSTEIDDGGSNVLIEHERGDKVDLASITILAYTRTERHSFKVGDPGVTVYGNGDKVFDPGEEIFISSSKDRSEIGVVILKLNDK